MYSEKRIKKKSKKTSIMRNTINVSDKIRESAESTKSEKTSNDISKHPDIDLVNNSLEYYDKYMEEYQYVLNKIYYCKFIDSDKDLEYNKIIFYNKDKEELFTTRYENIGIYQDINKLWSWAWSISTLKKNTTNIIRKILTYGTELDSDSLFIKNELITSKFKITHETQIDIILAISAYLSKKTFIYGLKLYDPRNIDSQGYVNLMDPLVEGKEIVFNIHYLFLLDIPKVE
jgi:hypothetical protein